MGNNLFVGILVVAVVLISGCVEERIETTTTTLKHETRPDHCELDSDCGWVGCCNYGYKCMRKDALHCPDDIICPAYSEPKPVNPCVCVDNKCSVQPTQGIIISTDKTEYEQGEAVNITAENGLDVSIWYLNAELCGAFNWWHLQKLEEDTWKQWDVHKPVEGKCLFCVREPAPVESFVNELKPDSEITDDWSLKNCERISPSGNELRLTDIETGVYRISFTYGLSKNNYAEKTIYSNEFMIKEKPTFSPELQLALEKFDRDDRVNIIAYFECDINEKKIEDLEDEYNLEFRRFSDGSFIQIMDRAFSINITVADLEKFINQSDVGYVEWGDGEYGRILQDGLCESLYKKSEELLGLYPQWRDEMPHPRPDEFDYNKILEDYTEALKYLRRARECYSEIGDIHRVSDCDRLMSLTNEYMLAIREELSELLRYKQACLDDVDCIEKCPACRDSSLTTGCTPRFKCVNGTCECDCTCLLTD